MAEWAVLQYVDNDWQADWLGSEAAAVAEAKRRVSSDKNAHIYLAEERFLVKAEAEVKVTNL